MIRLRQTGRTNDRSSNDRPCVTSQRQDRHLRLIHLRNRMITAEDTARRTPGLDIKVVYNDLVSYSCLNHTHRSLTVILTEPWHRRSCEN